MATGGGWGGWGGSGEPVELKIEDWWVMDGGWGAASRASQEAAAKFRRKHSSGSIGSMTVVSDSRYVPSPEFVF